jgi:hypothetical protein
MASADPGSFRDPASRIVHDGDRVLRLLDSRGLEGWRRLAETEFFSKAVGDGRLVEAKEVAHPPAGAAAALEHPRIPLITYPYEWTFSMLRDAALLQLDLLAEALAEGITIKDATPFNIQFVRGRPVFIDIGSFEAYQPGEPWLGYRQFTRQFLFPLMMRAWLGIPFQPWLRGNPEGPTAAEMRQLLPLGRRLRPSALAHVVLQARLEHRLSGEAVRNDLRQAGFSAELILANVRKLRKLVESMEWEPTTAVWTDYDSCSHVGQDRDSKSSFLADSLTRIRPDLLLDLGANDGHFSLLAAEHGAHAVAVDGDEPVLDRLYRSLGGEEVTPVLADLTNPSPSQGWAGKERPGLFDRVRPDLVVAYGLIHHLIYTASVPPPEVIEWLASFGCPVVVEFVAPEDPMIARLTANKEEAELHPGRTEEEFRSLVAGRFNVASEEALPSGHRRVFALLPL